MEAGSILLLLLITGAVISYKWITRAVTDGRERKRKNQEYRRLMKEVRAAERHADATERAVKASYLHGVVHGTKCRGCGRLEEDVQPVAGRGERAVPLCGSCREVLGAEDDEE